MGVERTPGSRLRNQPLSSAAGREPAVMSPRHPKRWNRYLYLVIAAEVSRFTRYFDRLVQWEPASHDPHVLFDAIQCPDKTVARTLDDLPDLSADRERRTAVLLNGNFNFDLDIQATLTRLKPKLSRTSRVVVVAYNPYLRWLYALADALGLRNSPPAVTFLTRADLEGLARLAGYEVVRLRPAGYSPFRLAGLGHFVNWSMPAVPGLRWASFVVVAVLRPLVRETRRPSLSLVIPARNEKGNIENALRRMPDLGAERVEIVFVEGHSTDDTWAEILRVAELYRVRFEIKTLQQTGKGKCDAVRLGFQRCTGELLAILDADLTMPPELLGRFYDAYCQGLADFVNGSRLLYPMEGQRVLREGAVVRAGKPSLRLALRNEARGAPRLRQVRRVAPRLRRLRPVRRLRAALPRKHFRVRHRRRADTVPRAHLRRDEHQPLPPRSDAAEDDALGPFPRPCGALAHRARYES